MRIVVNYHMLLDNKAHMILGGATSPACELPLKTLAGIADNA
jgi:hypothetical protein